MPSLSERDGRIVGVSLHARQDSDPAVTCREVAEDDAALVAWRAAKLAPTADPLKLLEARVSALEAASK